MDKLCLCSKRPTKQDFDDTWYFVKTMKIIAAGLNPLEHDTLADVYDYLSNEDKARVLDRLVYLFEKSEIEEILIGMQRLCKPSLKIIDENKYDLSLHPRFDEFE